MSHGRARHLYRGHQGVQNCVLYSALANQAANGRPVSKSSKASLGKCTNSASAAEFTKYRRASDAVGEWERLDLLQGGLEDRIAVCGEMQVAFESIWYYDRLFTKSLGRMLS
jgi:hypothetical protein